MTTTETNSKPYTFTLAQNGQQVTVDEHLITKLFHQIYYARAEKTWQNTFFFGLPLLKCPLDLWIYQEMIVELKPDLIIETGTHWGGSAFYLAVMLDILGKGSILTIDIDKKTKQIKHPRIHYLIGSSTSETIFKQVKERAANAEKVLVILDSDHSKDHVLGELRLYSQLVTPGSYCIVEDSNLNGHPVLPDYGPGPMEAIQTFLQENQNFQPDLSREKFLVTQNPSGYLKRIL